MTEAIADHSTEYARSAQKRHRSEGIRLFVKARLWAIVTVMVLMPIINPRIEVLYYEAAALLFSVIAITQIRMVHDERLWVEVLVLTADVTLLCVLSLAPNPLADAEIPLATQLNIAEFGYFFLFLALGTLAYSWKAIRFIGVLGALVWLLGVFGVWMWSEPHPSGPAVNDEPLKEIEIQNVAVLFVDIVGFTAYANAHSPKEVVHTLREFHSRMESSIFDNHGTLDKFLGDGLMATFGTPRAGVRDALNALRCAQAMSNTMADWNAERERSGQVNLRIGVGLHYGSCVIGDIGGQNRLEFAVIGNTVNIASRIEAKTRELGVEILMTSDLGERARVEAGGSSGLLSNLRRFEDQAIRGVSDPMALLGC